MKDYLKLMFVALALAMCSLHSAALTVRNDTLYIYDTWQQMFDNTPTKMMVNPLLDIVSSHEIHIVIGNEIAEQNFMDNHLAVTLGDSIWLLSSGYLKRYFKGDVKRLNGFIPVFFNEKAAFVTQIGKLSLKDCLIGSDIVSEYTNSSVDYYDIDFVKREVRKVSASRLKELLKSYHDLQMRYVGMKDYKKHHIVEEYYFKYIDRVTDDLSRPGILDIVN